MAKQPTQAQTAEFLRLRAFFQTVFEVLWSGIDMPLDHHPGVVADRLWAASPANALKGARAAASDMVEATQDFEGDALAALEARLAAAGAASSC